MAGKLIMTVGLPGSGKSTWASTLLANGAANLVVNKDTIREQMLIKDWNHDKEKEVVRIRDFKISEALSRGWTVVSDDTNLAPKHEAALRALAKKYKADFEINTTFTTMPIEECVKRDARRGQDGGRNVGEKVIRDMAEQFLTAKLPDLLPRTGSPQLFVDLDGVLADFDGFIESLGIVSDRDGPDRPGFWDDLRAYPGRLYYDMKPMPQARDLWNKLKGFKPMILTGVPWSIPNAANDKRQWVEEMVDPDTFVVCCKSRNKRLYAKAGDVLVDDWTKYKDLWEDMGGKFIHYTGNNITTLEQVREALRPTPTIMEG